ncbi:Crp/Fnr family transcriptional regulator [Enterovibrio paralichthyis]|uniref:Crp/Fnr family transcriptional regulator n=1 Tax=Enterovibrio paralichthyis TaxID=2853805 RepID=UPI001C44475D|nr:Crp/Fnr family transcriptional regulator [Enterovibrio paralichthyis]MBV7300769.1 Crp/Fnr family transcriptional regulator [Enterovibrio paralichthyis]
MKLSPYSYGRFRRTLSAETLQLRQLMKACVSHSCYFQEGEAILRQGEELEFLYIVPVGNVSMSIIAQNGRRFQLGRAHCDDHIFGEIEFFTRQPCQWNVTADEALNAEAVCLQKLKEQLLAHPLLLLHFASALAADYQDSLAIYTSRLMHSIAHNIASDLLQEKETTAYLVGFDKVTQEAERFGTSARVYRRAVNELIELGLVKREAGKLEIENEYGLRAFLDSHT